MTRVAHEYASNQQIVVNPQVVEPIGAQTEALCLGVLALAITAAANLRPLLKHPNTTFALEDVGIREELKS
jgi:hypothetical protein